MTQVFWLEIEAVYIPSVNVSKRIFRDEETKRRRDEETRDFAPLFYTDIVDKVERMVAVWCCRA